MTAFDVLRKRIQDGFHAALPDHIERLRWSHAQIVDVQRSGLRRLLAHAIEHSPFHRRRLARVDPSSFDLADLARLPVMTKDEMMDELDDVFTDRRLTRATVEAALAATTTQPTAIEGEYWAMATGGSSGRRGVYVVDVEASVAFVCSVSRNLVARLRAMGAPPMPIAMVSAASAVHATGAAGPLTSGGGMPFWFEPVPVTLPLAEIVERLNRLNLPALYGYPTMLARLAAEKRAGRLRIVPRMITATSETLTPELRAAITAGFDAPLVDTFGSSEGLAGVSAPNDPVLVFNSDLCIVEPVDDAYRPVPAGVASTRILVTNLANRVQPLIRYELTDRFVCEPMDGHLRATVQGRSDEVLRFDRVDVHPLVIRGVFVKQPAIADYQVQQTARGIDVSALAAEAVDADALRTQLAEALDGAGVVDPQVSVQIVTTLDRDAQTGKLRRFVPLR